MHGRHLISMADFSVEEVAHVIAVAQRLKRRDHGPLAQGKRQALLFDKPSLRTKGSFDSAMHELGGHTIYFGRDEVGLGQREPAKDVARVLSRYVDVITVRTFAHETVEELARYSGVPVVNALTDQEHPCQALADVLTIREHFGRTAGLRLAYVGDGNNVAASLAVAAASLGMHFVIAGPPGYAVAEGPWVEAERRAAASGGSLRRVREPADAVGGADIIYTDVWVSMGQDAERERRLRDFAGYTVDGALAALAPEARIMHDMPAHRGEEITDEVIESSRSLVFDQAENRLHAQKAVLALALGLVP